MALHLATIGIEINIMQAYTLSFLGGIWISSDGDNRRIFWGLKFSILGFFWVGKFGNSFFGWLDLSRDFWGYSKQSEDSW